MVSGGQGERESGGLNPSPLLEARVSLQLLRLPGSVEKKELGLTYKTGGKITTVKGLPRTGRDETLLWLP